MTYEELMAKVEELERENALLKVQLFRKPDPNAYERIRAAVSARVMELNQNGARHVKAALKRRIMEDLKWHLQVRYAKDFSDAHVEQALEFIRNCADGQEAC